MDKQYIHRILAVTFVLIVFIQPASAQRARVDSIIAVMQGIDFSKQIDTTRFESIQRLIETTILDDASVAVLERKAGSLMRGKSITPLYGIKSSIMISLIANDKVKAIDYGKQIFESLQNSDDTLEINIRSYFFRGLRIPYRTSNMLDEGFAYFNEKLKEFKLKNDHVGMADCYYVLAGFYRTKGLMETAIYNMKKSVSYMDSSATDYSHPTWFPSPVGRNSAINNISVVGFYYMLNGNYNESLKYLNIALKDVESSGLANVPTFIVMAKLMSGVTDSVESLLDYALKLNQVRSTKEYLAYALQAKAFYKITVNQLDEAEALLKECWQLIRQYNIPANSSAGTISPEYYVALIRIKQGRIPEAIAALQKDVGHILRLRLELLRDYKLLASLQEQKGDYLSASKSYKSFLSLQDSLIQDQKKYSSLSFETEQQMNAQELSINKLQSEKAIASLTRNFIIGIAVLLLVLAGVIYYRYKSKQKHNQVLEKTLTDLKTTQAQLVQAEKMASLGELTAGIAHEIQNPLNFVNNFSEMNQELLNEMNEEVSKENYTVVKQLAKDITANEEKIAYHGKRADAIVKNMLQHSRSGSGKKEPTDINALADEYLRLSYHGLRAKDKSFNANFKTSFDENVGKVNVMGQDVGRVLLNLYNNAFYAVSEKKKQFDDSYQPMIEVHTRRDGDKVVVHVKDNGTGIPEHVVKKIYQPFFTTKPTGDGTGLGLSLSYDIITKGHGGEMKVETKEGEGAEFTISLPID